MGYQRQQLAQMAQLARLAQLAQMTQLAGLPQLAQTLAGGAGPASTTMPRRALHCIHEQRQHCTNLSSELMHELET